MKSRLASDYLSCAKSSSNMEGQSISTQKWVADPGLASLCPGYKYQMTPKVDITVLVSFEIDRRDLFRANMDLSRWRFLAGIFAVLALVSSLGYFFFLIGEQNILLQTSPLFIGIPLLAVGGQVLRLHASARKFVASLSRSQRQIDYMFQANSDGYELTAGASFSHIAWKDVMKVVEKPLYFLIYRSRFEVGIVPKRGFRSADIPLFREIVRSRLGRQAKLSGH